MANKEPTSSKNAAYRLLQVKKNNPKAYRAMAEKAIELRRRGHRVSASWLIEWYRLEQPASFEQGQNAFKIDNTLSAALARSLMRDYPDELAGAFETRKAACDWAFKNEQAN